MSPVALNSACKGQTTEKGNIFQVSINLKVELRVSMNNQPEEQPWQLLKCSTEVGRVDSKRVTFGEKSIINVPLA